MKRKKAEEPENHERWLVSYADFITLLFALFVVMFATSQTDKGKAQEFSDSVKKALGSQNLPPAVVAILGGAVDNQGRGSAQMRGPGGARKAIPKDSKNTQESKQQMAELTPSLKILSKELAQEIKNGSIKITMQQRGLTISFQQAALFSSGDDEILPAAYSSIEKIAGAIRQIPNPVRLEGHTDSIPIHNTRFQSNWELSAARSISLLMVMTGRFSVEKERLSIAGYADTVPVADNDTDDGRSRNRRVDVVILNENGLKGEPGL